MKKLFGMIAIVLLFSSVVFGKTTKLSETQIKHNKGIIVFAVRTICVDGYKFVVTRDKAVYGNAVTGGVGLSLSTVQFYENQNGKAVPAKC